MTTKTVKSPVTGIESTEPMSIFEIIPLVRQEVGMIRKDQVATGGARYSYRSSDQIINALAPVLNKYGVFTTVEDHEFHHSSGVTASNKVLTTVTLLKRVRFYGPKGDYVESVTAGENSDYSDKATGGASTYAYRYALVQTFVLPTDEDDPDAKYVEKEAPKAAVAAPAPVSDEAKEIKDRLKAKSLKVEGDASGQAYLTILVDSSDLGKPFLELWKNGTVDELKKLEAIFDKAQS